MYQMISQLEIVIDKLHMVGHTDKWCKEVCDPINTGTLIRYLHMLYVCTIEVSEYVRALLKCQSMCVHY